MMQRLIPFGRRHGRNYIGGCSSSSSSSSPKKVFFSNFNLIPCHLLSSSSQTSCSYDSDSNYDFNIVMNILSNSAPSRRGHRIYSDLDAALNVTSLLQHDQHFILKVIETSCQKKLVNTPRVPPCDLIRYLKLVWKNNKDLITTAVVESLVSSICRRSSSSSSNVPTELPTKNDILFLWDFLNRIARYHPPGLLNARILNKLIQSFSVMGGCGDGKAALEVFNKFQVFHCVPNHDTCYFTLQALLNTSCSPDMIHQAASICQNMLLLLPRGHHDDDADSQQYVHPCSNGEDLQTGHDNFQTALSFLGGIPPLHLLPGRARVRANLNLTDFNPLRQQLHHFILKIIEISCQTKLIETRMVLPHNLIHFVKWAWRRSNNNDLITTPVLESLVSVICDGSADVYHDVHLRKNDILFLWDLLNNIGHCQTGLLNTQILNQLLYYFQFMSDQGKTALKVFHKFEVFQCVPNQDTHFFTLKALLSTGPSMSHEAASICQKMLLHPETLLPDDGEELGGIIYWFARNNMTKEAYALYLAAKENPKINHNWPLQLHTLFLHNTITVLCSKKETVHLAFEMFNDIPEVEEDRYICFKDIVFRHVAGALCGFKEFDAVKQLILKTIEDSQQHHLLRFAIRRLIPAFVKAGETKQALEMVMLLESKGLYTCNPYMIGFSYSNDMLHIRKILEEAKKKDSKLIVALLYHTLIVGYFKLRQFDRALKLLTEMKDFGVSHTNLDEYHKLFHSLCLMAMDKKMAMEQLEEMEPMEREMVENQLDNMHATDLHMADEQLEEMIEEQLEKVRISIH